MVPAITQGPPVPTPAPRGEILLGPVIILIIFAVLVLLAVKYKKLSIIEILFVVFLTIASFLIGLLWFSPISMGFAMICAFAGFTLALAIILAIRVVVQELRT